MKKRAIVKELKEKYPNKNIVLIPPENPSEILCEIDPTSLHPEKSTVIAIVGKAAAHYHKKSTEIYEVIRGVLTVNKEGKKYILKEKEKITINPGEVHYAEGNDVWFYAYSSPGWTFEDHKLIDK
ncbi:hypothetical protein A2954_06300 [Candidatus Roizmanbacteria bacterium RIFCSPLOWO2_01_FULL_37_12]|uniref:Cupin type-2 domain-containing protein n=1 Tax=Candidatus Roizmanbacteria bacterium RIFCSPLOWO2_01_FULL_37_12 TaxID=1802056 RepID=A0A1F7IAU4_9BACT|nr:MAG: hypothetical protein A2768_01640 [Candidatus Roizmanbacteria bacterium RIFCSPHIGHO2_01_FULL_37_16]OGK25767.1 MAG: hypothetical protein A3D76_02145 [Candidatus Roizmanbacteria bacterium RIFCSPHIGHO2_02_FULL_37_9b]OGK40468.1 MAG: hypothetical protein A2954_06300 [Candidatus Roizmanbacteria bacterium RIFCSPLOWO2_01_FULL_37_12]